MKHTAALFAYTCAVVSVSCAYAVSSENAGLDGKLDEPPVLNNKGHIILLLHFPALRYATVEHDKEGMKDFRVSVADRLSVSILAAAKSVNIMDVSKIKVFITDVVQSDPSWDYDDDEHDDDDDQSPPSRHHLKRPPPMDSTSTILVSRASFMDEHDLQIMKAFRVTLIKDPASIFGQQSDEFVRRYGLPECLEATLHIDSLDAPAGSIVSGLNAVKAAASWPDATVTSELQNAVMWSKIMGGMMALIVVSAMLFAVVMNTMASQVAQVYAMIDVEGSIFRDNALEY